MDKHKSTTDVYRPQAHAEKLERARQNVIEACSSLACCDLSAMAEDAINDLIDAKIELALLERGGE